MGQMLINRREFMMSAAAASWVAPQDKTASSSDMTVPPLDATKIRPSDFADADLDMPFALVHFARVANSVLLDGPDRGFISLSVWRGGGGTAQNRPYNARIMESILTLVWFYTARHQWNPYRGHPALRARLELALDFWCRIQSSDGQFSEHGPQQGNLAATSFAVKFMSKSLRLLKG